MDKSTTKRKRKRRMPTFNQWAALRLVLGNGWGDGDFALEYSERERRKYVKAIQAFESWLEDRYGVEWTVRTA